MHIPRKLTRDEMEKAAIFYRTILEGRLPWLAGLHTPEEDRNYFKGNIFDQCEVWGCFDSSDLLGFIAFKENLIEKFYVLPKYQCHGVGSALLAVAEQKFSEFYLWTFQKNLAAREFYEKRGFVAVEMTDGANNSEKEPDVRYHWRAQKTLAAPKLYPRINQELCSLKAHRRGCKRRTLAPCG